MYALFRVLRTVLGLYFMLTTDSDDSRKSLEGSSFAKLINDKIIKLFYIGTRLFTPNT